MKTYHLYTTILLLILANLFTGCSSKNLEWNQGEGYKWAELSPGYFGSPGFTHLSTSSTNIEFVNNARRESITENRNHLNGSGVTAGDIDGDGRVDLYFAQLDGPNKLYKNMGDFHFKDITHRAGVAHEGYKSTGTVFADIDGDYDLDLLVSSLNKKNELYINDGEGNFHLKKNSGLGEAKGSNTLALADIDGDGDLDLYVTNFKTKTARDIYSAEELSTENTVKKQGDTLVVVPPFDKYYGIIKTDGRSYRNEYGEKDELYINTGDGTFTLADDKEYFWDGNNNSIGLARDWGLAAKFQDLNQDGFADLYVANDFWTPDRIWINKGDGTFERINKNAFKNMSLSAMGVDFSDINRDGFVDLFVTEMLSKNHQRHKRQLTDYLDPIEGRPQYNRNSLFLNRGDHTFAEISHFANVEASEWSWVAQFLDIDLDGYEDLIITTGNQYDYLDMDTQQRLNNQSRGSSGYMGDIVKYPLLEVPNKIFKNNGDLTFADKGSQWGFTEKDISMGLAYADLDNDGDSDLIINRFNQKAAVYRNTTNAARIVIQLKGNPPNTHGVGAKVKLEGAAVPQSKEMVSGGSYVSGSEYSLTFAADNSNNNHKITVEWGDGTKTTLDRVKANRIYVIDQGSAGNVNNRREEVAGDTIKKTLFQDISGHIPHQHHEDLYNDFNVQPLLPLKLSKQGPGISWIDYDKDGHDDLFIASGKGEKLSLFQNKGNGKFEPKEIEGLSTKAPGDQTGIIGWSSGNKSNIIVGSANFEQGDPNVPSAFYYSIDKSTRKIDRSDSIPGILSTTGPLAASDIDQDGDLDVFLGGRFKPGKYPQDANSRLFKNNEGSFELDETHFKTFSEIGLVSSAVFSDYDRDGDQDLLISRPWDSIALFENRNGVFENITEKTGLHSYKGWWNGIATGDFNNDGLPDIIATNIGKNSIYRPTQDEPARLYYADFDINGTLDIIDSYYDKEIKGYVPRQKLYEFDSMPSVLSSVRSHKEFASSTVDEIFQQDFHSVPYKEINTSEHMIFLNNGNGFDAQPLPVESQFSAAFGAAVADYNNDGNEDLFLSQNLYAFPQNTPRLDAGRGLVLQGDGKGNFAAIPGQESGIRIYGEQRGAAVSDINNDHRTDLAVGQNQGPVKLFLNNTPKEGYRITLRGPDKNKSAVGSSIRLKYADGSWGPLRGIQAGSGYWSQNSATQILGATGKVSAIEVKWFDGNVDEVPVKGDTKNYTIRYNLPE